MSASLTIEEERGTFSGRPNRHNGYYAGDFSAGPHPSESGIRMRPPSHSRIAKRAAAVHVIARSGSRL